MKRIITSCIAVLFVMNLISQDYKELIDAKIVNFHGLDFTRAKFIGESGFKQIDRILENSVKGGWNYMLFDEWEKYNISKALGKKEVRYYPDVANERNETVEKEGLIINKSYDLNEDVIKKAISEYPKREVEGISMVMMIESLNKTFEKATLWFVFFNESTGDIILAQEYQTKPFGYGVHNYWANSFYIALKKLKKCYKKWSKGKKA